LLRSGRCGGGKTTARIQHPSPRAGTGEFRANVTPEPDTAAPEPFPRWLRRRWGVVAAVWLVVAGTSLPAVGRVLALRWRRAVAAALFGAGAVICLLAGLGFHAVTTPDGPPAPDPVHRVCQEHSGDDNRCPGN
jgi:hypothetical protein